MKDLISRQAAIDALDEQIALCNKALGSFDISMKDEYAVKVERASLKAYRETLNVLPSAQPVQWIPCSERLPDKSGTYICNCVESDINHVTFIKWQSRYKRWDLNGRRTFWRVTAWKPIPEPYERRQE